MSRHWVSIAVGLLCFLAGFLLGRQLINEKEEIKYVKGDTVKQIVEVPQPYRVEIPAKPVYVYRTDTVDRLVVQVVDSAKIVEDWTACRSYKQTLFDDRNGRLDVDLSVQYNSLQRLSYEFIPIHKEVTVARQPVWQPFVSASYSSLGGMGIGGGVFYHRLGVEFRYVTDFDRKGMDVSLKYKF
ncbi:hypothetical protein M2132_000811 [Dysgonomonas sp. PH5-45]|uniref:hypothetical protein n=1 Tax=unclassified Dysgonomonas TaxID=2630389 RepID=UPI0024766AA5|nr:MULTISPECIES: hypothetical protein [unclassified Dysgonomonas]MDH6354483.1 hypothetical protein [Dysgonomonas sp. PH5-45]MDH6387460.1 hypothetical protein [Dysgonomonas sp. PH5-37]